MARTKSAIKRHRQSLKRRERNRAVKSRIKTLIKRVLTAVEAKDTENAVKIFRDTVSLLHKASQKRIIPKNTASRKISRISRKINELLKEKAV